jgi:hypothetical protein
MIKRHTHSSTFSPMIEEISQPTIALNMSSKHAPEHSRSIGLVYTANSQESYRGSASLTLCRFEWKKGGGAVSAI